MNKVWYVTLNLEDCSLLRPKSYLKTRFLSHRKHTAGPLNDVSANTKAIRLKIDLEFAFVAVMTMKITVFWDVKQCSFKCPTFRKKLLPPIYDYPEYTEQIPSKNRYHSATHYNIHPRRKYFFANNFCLGWKNHKSSMENNITLPTTLLCLYRQRTLHCKLYCFNINNTMLIYIFIPRDLQKS